MGDVASKNRLSSEDITPLSEHFGPFAVNNTDVSILLGRELSVNVGLNYIYFEIAVSLRAKLVVAVYILSNVISTRAKKAAIQYQKHWATKKVALTQAQALTIPLHRQ
jgi:hypothetical protein